MRKIIATILVLFSTAAHAASPCDGVSRGLSNELRAQLEPVIASQLHVPKVDVLQSFRFAEWSIIYVNSHHADEAYLFYAGDPLTNQYVSLWSGAATKYEEKEIKAWTLKNISGTPEKLANCFSWHVTNDRDE